MKIRKVAVGNAAEAFIEGNFTNGVNIISSDDNNKGKTIVIQSMMYALGNEPTFPTSFEFQKYYYYIEFEEAGIIFKLCRSGDGFVLKRESTVLIFDNVSELKRYWNRNIFLLPSIAKNQLLRIVDPVLYVQLFFIGQDKKDTSNIANHGFYNKQDFIDMLYAYAGLIGEQLPQERIDEIKSHRSPHTQDALETAEVIIGDVLLDHLGQLLPAGKTPAIVTLPLEDAHKPSIGPLSMHFPTRDMLCVMPAAASLSWKIWVV